MKKVFLGGTCNGSSWREELIPMLKCEYFNPVVKDWTPECQEEERRQKVICDCQLYVITARMRGVFSIAEVVDSSNKAPENTILCIITEDNYDGHSFFDFEKKSLNAVKELVKSNGAYVFDSLEEVAEFINK